MRYTFTIMQCDSGFTVACQPLHSSPKPEPWAIQAPAPPLAPPSASTLHAFSSFSEASAFIERCLVGEA